MTRERFAHIVLRSGAAYAFLYPAIRAFYDPNSWLGYIPRSVLALPSKVGMAVDGLTILHVFSIFQIMIALWILSGRHIRIPAILATLTLLAVVAFNWVLMDNLFRDLSIVAMTLALTVWPSAEVRAV